MIKIKVTDRLFAPPTRLPSHSVVGLDVLPTPGALARAVTLHPVVHQDGLKHCTRNCPFK